MSKKSELQYTQHFTDMLKERSIPMSWITQTLNDPEKVEDQPDGTRHFLRRITKHGNRWLRVVLNITVVPNKAVTAFFDPRLRGEQ